MELFCELIINYVSSLSLCAGLQTKDRDSKEGVFEEACSLQSKLSVKGRLKDIKDKYL